MDKLLPCPFCGGEGCIQEHVFVGYTSTFGVVCIDCCAETRQFFNTKDKAIAAWNRRADAVPVVRGEWIVTDAYPHRVYCSLCYKTNVLNEEWLYEKNDYPKYCMWCGAKMEDKP